MVKYFDKYFTGSLSLYRPDTRQANKKIYKTLKKKRGPGRHCGRQ